MKLIDIKFVKSVALKSEEVYFDEKQEIVFVGRSNVGKSSLMNSIFWKKDLVKTSSMPWKTRTANLFLLNNKYYLTDLPGYGFARLGQELRQDLDNLISWYLEERKSHLKMVVMLIDSKIWPQWSDFDMYEYILKLELPVCIVITKVDRLWNSWTKQSLIHSEKEFFWQKVFAVSASKMEWIKELTKFLFDKFGK